MRVTSFVTTAVALLTGTTIANPVAVAALEEAPSSLVPRDGVAVNVKIYNPGSCAAGTAWEGSVGPGVCKDIGSGGHYGATFQNGANQICVAKFWDGPNCSGGTTTWAIRQQVNTQCTPIANNLAGFKLVSGIRSFQLSCAAEIAPV